MKTVEYYVDLLSSKGFLWEATIDGEKLVFINNEIDPTFNIIIGFDNTNLDEPYNIKSLLDKLSPTTITFYNLKNVPLNFYSGHGDFFGGHEDKNNVFLVKDDLYLFEYVLDIITDDNSLFNFIKTYNSEFANFIEKINIIIPIIEKYNFTKNKDYSIFSKYENDNKTICDSLVIKYCNKILVNNNLNRITQNIFFIFESLTWKKYLKIKNDYFGDPVTIDLNKDFNIIDLINVLSNK